jgi:hypothetical protein
MLYKVALHRIMLYKLGNHSLNSSLLQPTPTTNLLVTSYRTWQKFIQIDSK